VVRKGGGGERGEEMREGEQRRHNVSHITTPLTQSVHPALTV